MPALGNRECHEGNRRAMKWPRDPLENKRDLTRLGNAFTSLRKSVLEPYEFFRRIG